MDSTLEVQLHDGWEVVGHKIEPPVKDSEGQPYWERCGPIKKCVYVMGAGKLIGPIIVDDDIDKPDHDEHDHGEGGSGKDGSGKAIGGTKGSGQEKRTPRMVEKAAPQKKKSGKRV